ncbi:MAG: metallophosphoesterase [Candidatus Parcubacteria bacterium]|nr:metallophosphoesterase [Candidatus Parcubacteria bacterium]
MSKKSISGKKIFLLLVILTGFYFFIEPFWLNVHRIDIYSEEIPVGFDNKSIAFLSDIHCGPYFPISRVKGLVTTVNYLNPDLAVLTGDYIQYGEKYINDCFAELKNIQTRYGSYAVLGNHDIWSSGESIKQKIKENNITLLDNFALWLNIGEDKIKLGGVGDYLSDKQDLSFTLSNLKINDFSILLSHNPDYADELTPEELDRIDHALRTYPWRASLSLWSLVYLSICLR